MSIASLARAATVLTLVAALVLLSGCVKSEETQTIAADGSGTATVTMVVNMEKLKQIQEMAKSMMPPGAEQEQEEEEDPFADFEAEAIKKRFAKLEGVRLIKAETSTDHGNNVRTNTIEVAFDSLEALYKSGVVPNMSVKLEKTGENEFMLTREMTGKDGEDMPTDPQQIEMVKGMMMMFESMMGDLEFKTRITLPGTTVETNGAKEGPNTVSWRITFENVLDLPTRKQFVKFKGEGLTMKPFTLTAAEIGEALKKLEGEDEEEQPVTPTEEEGEKPVAPPPEKEEPAGMPGAR